MNVPRQQFSHRLATLLLTFAGTCAYRSSHFAVAVKIVSRLRPVYSARAQIGRHDRLGISRDYNLSVALRRHTVAKGATLSSDGCNR